jgi:hypothetical protein
MQASPGLEPNFSTLTISFASAAIIYMGLEKNPHTNQFEKNLDVAQFNIDMLLLLREKTKGNLTSEEANYLNAIITDLQLKFVAQK